MDAELEQVRHDAGVLRELTRTTYWDLFRRYAENMERAAIERMMDGTKEDFDYFKGVIMGYRDLLALPVAVEREADARSQLLGE